MHLQRLLLLFVASNSGKRYWDWTLPRIRAQIELYMSSTFINLWLQNKHEWHFCEEFAPHPGGTNHKDAHAFEPNYVTVQIKLSQTYCPRTNLQFWSFCHSFLQRMSSIFLNHYVLLWNTTFLQIGFSGMGIIVAVSQFFFRRHFVEKIKGFLIGGKIVSKYGNKSKPKKKGGGVKLCVYVTGLIWYAPNFPSRINKGV